MKPHSWWPLGLALILALPACDGLLTDEHVCSTGIEHALEIRVEDAATGAPIATGAVGRARDGAYSDSLRVVSWTGPGAGQLATTLGGADERPGLYQIELQRPGYARWDTSGVRVHQGTCHVETVHLVARLQRLP